MLKRSIEDGNTKSATATHPTFPTDSTMRGKFLTTPYISPPMPPMPPNQASAEDPALTRGPTRASATVLGLVADQKLQRDSLTSVRVGDRQFWTSRDATCFENQPFFFFTSTASWTRFNKDGQPEIDEDGLRTVGDNATTYFPAGPGRFPPHGNSGNGQERWLVWPDSPPLPVNGEDGTVKLYTWIKNAHQNADGEVDSGDFPSTSLYRADHAPGAKYPDALPPATLIAPAFWPPNSIAYGSYGWLIGIDGQVYLYGLGAHSGGGAALARVAPHAIEDARAYRFYSHSTARWSSAAPAPTDAGVLISNAGTGQQGTFYHSRRFGCYIWIGGRSPCNSEFQLATAPEPWGPWTAPRTFYVAPPGHTFAGYSWQAHPGLSEDLGHGKDIYLTFTRINKYYENVLIRVEWH